MKVVCDNKIPFLGGVLEPYAEVLYLPGSKISAEDVRDADALITRTRTVCNQALLEGSKVKVIATATIGYDHIDTAWCESHGILWKNAPGCNSWSVKQYISSVLVRLARIHGLELDSMTLGVIGVGNVGSKVAEAARLLGMKVLLNDPPRERREGHNAFVSLDELISRSDVITLHVPLSKEGEDATWHLFDASRLSLLCGDQILINSSRGPVVDNKALETALAAHAIKGAVLDVWEDEPDIDRELIKLLDISTPHIAGYSADGKANGTAASVRTVAEYFDLPLKNWMPESIPAPSQSLDFRLDAFGIPPQEILSEAILHTYDVLEDSANLRRHPEFFERLRGDYPVRREFAAFTLHLSNGTPQVASVLSNLGFKVKYN